MPEGYEPLRGRAAWAQRALVATVVIDLIAIASGFAEYRLYQQDVVTPEELDSTDIRQGLVALAQTIVFIFAVVMFIRWFKRAYANLQALGLPELRFRVGWAIWGWFVPFLNLWRPKQIANDIWRASDPEKPRDQDPLWRGADVPALFQWWWAFYLISTWLENISFRVELNANDLQGYKNAAAATMAVNAFEAVAGVLAVLVVDRTTRRQEARAARLAQS